jgi:hypothetical protein
LSFILISLALAFLFFYAFFQILPSLSFFFKIFFFYTIPSLSFLFPPFFFLGSSNSDKESERLTKGKGDRLRERNREFEREKFTREKRCRDQVEARSSMGLRCPSPTKLWCEL